MERNEAWNGDVKTVGLALKTKLWREEPGQAQKWLDLLEMLCFEHSVAIPRLEIVNDLEVPCYRRVPSPTIVLDKFSLISLLHEFGHHLGYDEKTCKEYSEQVYQRAYPSGWAKLVRDERGYMVKRPMTITPEVRSIA